MFHFFGFGNRFAVETIFTYTDPVSHLYPDALCVRHLYPGNLYIETGIGGDYLSGRLFDSALDGGKRHDAACKFNPDCKFYPPGSFYFYFLAGISSLPAIFPGIRPCRQSASEIEKNESHHPERNQKKH